MKEEAMCQKCAFDKNKYCLYHRFAIYDDTQKCTKFVKRKDKEN